MQKQEVKAKLKALMLDLKDVITSINDVAVKNNFFVDEPTLILNLSCGCDEIIGIIDNDGKGTY